MSCLETLVFCALWRIIEQRKQESGEAFKKLIKIASVRTGISLVYEVAQYCTATLREPITLLSLSEEIYTHFYPLAATGYTHLILPLNSITLSPLNPALQEFPW
jgi:hypothetical protein